MAGSYQHVIDDQGRLLPPGKMMEMLDTGGDVFEAIEEMYGMIWWLARVVAGEQYQENWSALNKQTQMGVIADWVESARQEHVEGINVSPGPAEDD